MTSTGAGRAGSEADAGALGPRRALRGVGRSEEGRVVAGVCSGIAQTMAVDVTLVRLVFAVLALASGSGILLYLGFWLLLPRPGGEARGRAPAVVGAALLVGGGALALRGLGLDDSVLWPAALGAAGAALLTGGELANAAGALRRPLGIALVCAGVLFFFRYSQPFGPEGALIAPGAVATGLLLVVVPWLWRLVREREAERTERVRSEERAELAARVHDSVLQTLALIQRDAAEPRRVATLARRQERELRAWLYPTATRKGEGTLAAAIEAAAAEVEEVHGVRVDVVGSGDCPLDERVDALVLAAREAMVNAAKFSGVDEVSVYVEATAERASVFVRDRGAGFDRERVPPDRRGLTESIEGRLARNGGTASVTSAPGVGTEVELILPRAIR